MKRKLLFGERMLLGDGTEPFNAVIPFRLRGVFSEEDIKYALSRLQEKHPWLRALIQHDEQNVPWFQVPELTVSIPIRLVNRKSEDDWQEESKKEWHSTFDHQTKPLIRFVWIKGEEVSDMLFVFHHCLCDGGSAMALLYEFLKLLENPAAEIGLENPILGIEDVVPEQILQSGKKRFKAKAIGRLAALAIKCIPVSKRAIDRQTDYLIHWKLDETTSKQLISFCKSSGVTVNTFLGATVLEAFKKVRGSSAFNKVSCPVDIRRFAPQIKDDHIFAFGLMIVMSSNQKMSFLDNLRLMQDEVERKTAKLNPYITMMVMESAHDALKNFTRLLKRGKSSNDCMFSNLGCIQIPDQYQEFNLETIFSPSVIGPLGNTTTMVTSTYRGQMDFSFVGSEGYLPETEALAIRDEIIDRIKQQLDYQEAS
ncbi:condensation domain-containing protein [Sphingobacterium sp. NGMCC 1.201703]|uniref:condensation domain-containing protein n=1 Tax=Sphingobacterium sp. NGMCC 1.201703 TaxID=3388657 RepID=UPI0039FDB6CE